MTLFNELSENVIAALSALGVSVVLMAVAIAPATQSLSGTGMMA